MNREFKKIKGKTETRYVLEAASGGATSSAAVATGPVAKDNLLVQNKEGKPEVQRRNPVAANVNAAVGGGGAGAHVDRKKKDKSIRGQKYKPNWRSGVDESGLQYYTGKKKYGKDGMAALAKAGRDGASEEELGRIKDKYKKNEGYGMGGYATVAGGAQISKAVPEADIDSGYIDQENDMTASDLKSLYKQAVRLRDLIQKMGNDTTLEPWQQTKIAKAADYVNAVFRSLDNEYGLEEEKQKGLDGKACWKGYKRMGTKMKGGKRVDNCVPIKEEVEINVPGFGTLTMEMLKKHVKELSKDFNEYIQNDEFLKAAYRTEQFYNALMALAKAIKSTDKEMSVVEDNLKEYETHTYTDKMGRKWRVDDEGNKDLIYDPTDRFTRRSYTNRYPTSSQPSVYYFYNVPDGSAMQAHSLGLKRTKSGKWYSPSPNAEAEKVFGAARMWRPKNENAVSEKMMPASHFAGTPKHKLGPAAHLKGKMNRPARQGDLVGDAEESYSKKKTLKKN